jgi:hypothetical protein
MRSFVVCTLVGVCLGWAPVRAGDVAADEAKQDVVLRALVDELARNQDGLKLAGFDIPYYLGFAVNDYNRVGVTAVFGAVTRHTEDRSRSLSTDVRVGSYVLDNSNFSGGGGFGFGGEGGVETAMPIEDDYAGIRQAIWFLADRDYKNVVEELAQKKAVMESKLIVDKPDDFAHEAPTVHFDLRLDLALAEQRLAELATALSLVFRDYPELQSSSVSVGAYAGNKYLVNTEGTRLRAATQRLTLSARATVQADDGMKLGDAVSVYTSGLDALPPRDELIESCREMAQRLVALKQAPVLASYSGPVLFEAEAATALFARQFGGAFGGGQRPVGSRTSPDDFANKLNKRILPRFFQVVDDATREQIGDARVMGHYAFDDEGVPTRPLTLVEGGRLKALLMSRNPSKEFSQSTGHGRGSLAAGRGSVACLEVTADPGLSADGLKQELVDACADEGLEFGLRVVSLGAVGEGGRGFEAGGGGNPLVMYKVFPDGREELVRGAEIAKIDLKAFKRILAAGDQPFVLNTGGGGSEGQTVAAPAMLFEELDLAKLDRDFDKPPILPTPLARE